MHTREKALEVPRAERCLKKKVQKINLVNTKDPPINNSVPSNLIRDLARIPLANLNKGLLKDIMI